jgi:signal recognition particle receptor subunit beta
MSTINPLSRQVSAKIVYVGPGLSGKTTSLRYIHSRLSPDIRGDLVSLATDEDRTLFFDFLPLRVPRVHGLGVRLHLYTVPGQVFYAATRKLVLDGADGIVFVADVQPARREANIQSLESAKEHLEEMGIDLGEFPMVFQYNKRDLEGGLTDEELQADLNSWRMPEFDTVATEGTGVLEALRAIVTSVVRSLSGNANVRRGATYAPGARADTDIATQLARLADEEVGRALSAPAPEMVALPRNIKENATRRVLSDASPSRFGNLSPTPRSKSTPGTNGGPLPQIELEVEPLVEEAQDHIQTERPVAGVSFSELWDSGQRSPIALIESRITAQRYDDAVHHVASALAQLLNKLPVPEDTGMGSRAALAGLDGHEYLQLCRLASQPKETISLRDALFAFYVLVAAQVRVSSLNLTR